MKYQISQVKVEKKSLHNLFLSYLFIDLVEPRQLQYDTST